MLGLGVLLGLLGAVIGLELNMPLGTVRGSVPVPATTRLMTKVAASPKPRPPRKAWVAEILGRPLFSATRRPPEQLAAIPGLPRLTAIVIDGTRRIAIFAAHPGGKPVTVEVGARIGEFDVRAISHTEVTLAGPEGQIVTRPTFDSARLFRVPEQLGPAALLKVR
ncbi:MAG TPA: hypothetical protein VHO91_04660 [Rhodopila sp.]|nr:hypothetical protein [Rhodopila sp.]